MKKILTIILILCAVSLTSCEKEAGRSTAFDGTSWQGVYTSKGEEITVICKFQNGVAAYSIGKLPYNMSLYGGPYDYSAPHLTMSFSSFSVSGVVSGDQMVLSTEKDGPNFITIYKK